MIAGRLAERLSRALRDRNAIVTELARLVSHTSDEDIQRDLRFRDLVLGLARDGRLAEHLERRVLERCGEDGGRLCGFLDEPLVLTLAQSSQFSDLVRHLGWALGDEHPAFPLVERMFQLLQEAGG